MKRIRYFNKGDYVESRVMVMGNQLIVVKITNDCCVLVTNIETRELLFEQSYKTRAEALKRVKNWLILSGVVFEDEVRKVVKLGRSNDKTERASL